MPLKFHKKPDRPFGRVSGLTTTRNEFIDFAVKFKRVSKADGKLVTTRPFYFF